MQISTYLRALRRRWLWVAVLAVLGAAAGIGIGLVGTPVYSTTMSIYISVNTSTNATGGSQLSDDQLAERRANSYVQLLSSQKLAETIIDDTGIDLTPRQVMDAISGSAQANTVLLDVDVHDTDANRSLVIGQSIARNFPLFVTSLGNGDNDVVLNVVSGPTLHQAPISPRKTLDGVAGLIAGLLIGIVIAIVRDLRDTSFGSSQDLEQVSDRPVLGEIPFDNSIRNASPVLVADALRSSRAEAYRLVRTNLQFADVDNPPQVIIVTSSTPEEGKSSTAVNLAILFAEANRDTLLLEADLRRPQAAAYLGLGSGIGLTDVLSSSASFEDALQEFSTGVTVMGCGRTPPNPSELLGSRNMGVLMQTMRENFDVVIIDTPPLGPVTDAAVLARLADGVVVTVREGRTGRPELERTLQRLEAVDARVFGFVMTMSKAKPPRDGYYAYSATDGPTRPRVDTPALPTAAGSARPTPGSPTPAARPVTPPTATSPGNGASRTAPGGRSEPFDPAAPPRTGNGVGVPRADDPVSRLRRP